LRPPQKLEGELADERRRLSQQMEHQVYIESLAAGALPEAGVAAPVPVDPKKHRFQAASSGARSAGAQAFEGFASSIDLAKWKQQFLGGDGAMVKQLEARMAFVKDKGLTPAEHAATITYTP